MKSLLKVSAAIDLRSGTIGERKLCRDFSKIFFLLTMARIVIMMIFCVTSMRKKGSFYRRRENSYWEIILGSSDLTFLQIHVIRLTSIRRLKQSLFLLSSVEWVQHKMALLFFSLLSLQDIRFFHVIGFCFSKR